MFSHREDFIMRAIRQAIESIRQILARLGGGAKAAEVLPIIRKVEGELLGERADILRSLDARTAAQILGREDVVRQWAGLLRLEAEAHRHDGDEAAASAAETRAAALEGHAG